MSLVAFQGYAAPFNQFGIIRPGYYERIACGAFREMVARGVSVPIMLGGHTGRPLIAHTERLFEDSYGLGFSFHLDMKRNKNGGHLHSITRSFSFASIHFAYRIGEWQTIGDEQHRYITSAAIDHIAVCDETAVYKGSGVWRADAGFLPNRLQALRRRWLDSPMTGWWPKAVVGE